jgi:hypothetical protein
MNAAWAMTGFALELPVSERRMLIAGNRVRPAEDCQCHFVIVATEAGVGTTA